MYKPDFIEVRYNVCSVYPEMVYLHMLTGQVMEEVSMLELAGRHPNVVTLQAFFEDQDFYYIVMDLCQGGELYHQLADKVGLDSIDILLLRFTSCGRGCVGCSTANECPSLEAFQDAGAIHSLFVFRSL